MVLQSEKVRSLSEQSQVSVWLHMLAEEQKGINTCSFNQEAAE